MKKKGIIIAALTTLAVAAFAAGCGASKVDKTLDEYQYNYHGVFEDVHDEDVKIDGVLDDQIWQNKKYFTNTSAATNIANDVHIAVTMAATKKGVYVGAYATDNNVQYISSFNERSSHFRLFLSKPDNDVFNAAHVKQFYVYKDAVKSQFGTRYSSAATVEDGRFTIELFVSYESLNIDPTDYAGEEDYVEGILPRLKLYTVYRVCNDTSGNSYYDIYSGFGGTQQPSMYPLFNKDGYTMVDKEDAVLGDAINGYAKTNGWILDEEPQGSVTVDGANWQVIYFRKAYSSVFSEEAYVEYLNTSSSGAKVGLLTTVDQVNFRAFLLDASSGNLTANGSGVAFKDANVYGLTYYPDATWHMSDLALDRTIDMTKYGNRIKLKTVKDGNKFYYFVNDVLITSETCNYASGKAFAGFYALDSHARFTDYSYTDLENDSEGLAEALTGAARIELSNGAGGEIVADKLAVKAGGEFKLTFKNWLGYVLSSVKVNGEEVINDITVTDGVFTLSNVTEDVSVSAQFEPMENTEDAVFHLKGVKGETVGGSVYVESNENKKLFWNTEAPATAKGLQLALPAGEYTATVDSPGLRRCIYPFTVEEGEENEFNVQLELAMIGNVETPDFSMASSTTGWDYSQEYLGKMSASQNANWEFVYFTGHYAQDAIIKMSIENSTPSGVEREKYPSVLWTVLTKENRISLGIINKKVRVFYTNGVWDSSAAGGYIQSENDVLSKSFSDIGAKLDLMLVRKGNHFYIFEKIGDKYSMVFDYQTTSVNDVTGNAIYGLTVGSATNVALGVTFSDFEIISGADAQDEIEQLLAPEPEVDTGVFGNVTVNGKEVETDDKAINYENVDDETKPEISFTQGKLNSTAYFKDAVGETAVIKATIHNYWTSGDKYSQAGFIINDGTNKVAIMLIAKKVRVFPNGTYVSSGYIQEPNKDLLTGSMLGDAAADLKMTLVRYSGTYYLFEEVNGEQNCIWSLSATDGRLAQVTGNAAYGFSVYMADGVTGRISFSDFSALVGADAVTEAEELLDEILHPTDPPFEAGIFGDIEVNGIELKANQTEFDYTNVATGIVGSKHDGSPAVTYFKDVISDTVIIKASLQNDWTSGDQYSQMGFAITDGTRSVYVLAINQKVRVHYYNGATKAKEETTSTAVLNGSMMGTNPAKAAIKLAFIRYEGTYYLYEELSGGTYNLVWSMADTSGDVKITGDAAYGFAFMTGTNIVSAHRFTNYTVKSGSAATNDILAILPNENPGDTFGDVTVNGKQVTSSTDFVVDYTHVNDTAPSISFTGGEMPTAAYFNGKVSDTAVITVTIHNYWTSGDSYSQAGFIINDGTNKIAILLIAPKVRFYKNGTFSGGYVQEPNTNLFTGSMLGNAATDLKITFVRYNRIYYLFENVNGTNREVWKSTDMTTDVSAELGQITGDAAYGFTVQNNSNYVGEIKFSDYSILTGDEAKTKAQELLGSGN